MERLSLTLKDQWFRMIASGIKKEEYREIKPFWDSRIWKYRDQIKEVMFLRGRSSMVFEIDDIVIGRGKPEWGAPPCDVYILKLGKRVK